MADEAAILRALCAPDAPDYVTLEWLSQRLGEPVTEADMNGLIRKRHALYVSEHPKGTKAGYMATLGGAAAAQVKT